MGDDAAAEASAARQARAQGLDGAKPAEPVDGAGPAKTLSANSYTQLSPLKFKLVFGSMLLGVFMAGLDWTMCVFSHL